MPDTRYLQKRDGCWYIRIARPNSGASAEKSSSIR
jgi:hypothetical protein